jgi:hypothetical protein
MCDDAVMKPHPEMIEGPEAFNRFKRAVQAILKVRKSDMPPSPFGRSGKKRKPKSQNNG